MFFDRVKKSSHHGRNSEINSRNQLEKNMLLLLRKNIFVLSVSLITVIAILLIRYLFPGSNYVSKEYLTSAAGILQVVFLLVFLAIGLADFLKTNNQLKDFFTLRNALIASIIVSLVFSITKPVIGY